MGSDPKRFLALKKPCADCPFRKRDGIGLCAERRQQIADSLRHGDTFSCHKTVVYTDDGSNTEDSARCFGAASVLHKGGDAPMAVEQIAVRLGIAEPASEEGLSTPATWDSLDDFIELGKEW